MMIIIDCSELTGADKYGSCQCCGAGSKEKKMFKIVFKNIHGHSSSIHLCGACMKTLARRIESIK